MGKSSSPLEVAPYLYAMHALLQLFVMWHNPCPCTAAGKAQQRHSDCLFLDSLKNTQPPGNPSQFSPQPTEAQKSLFLHLSDTIKISTWVAEMLNGEGSQWEGSKEEIK